MAQSSKLKAQGSLLKAHSFSIIGAGKSGLAVARLLREDGARVFVSDSGSMKDETLKKLEEIGVEYEFGGHTQKVLDADVIVLSPGVPPTISILREAGERGIPLTNEIEIASRYCEGAIVGVTGTNGKTTTTELIGHIFREAGWKTFVAGNVGTPFSEIAREADESSVVALELSSFQLEKIETLHPKVAVVLNVTPDHLDRYVSIDEYGEAKLRIAMNQGPDDRLIYNADDEWLSRISGGDIAPALLEYSIEREVESGAFVRDAKLVLRKRKGEKVVEVIRVEEIGIRGPHNLGNSMAAALAAHGMGVEVDSIRQALASFRSLPHRLEEVAVIDGVRYVNDSKGTNTDALRYALESFTEPIVLIAGGRAKKNDYTALLPLIRKHVKAAVLIGEAAEEMEAVFDPLTETVRAGFSMEQALGSAASIAEPGDVVLLSPACASFDMFDNFEHRGETFKALVRELAKRVDRVV